jgi:uncharacterized protein
MLKVDLGRLAREHRLRIDEDVPPDDPLWEGSGIRFDGPVTVALDVQQAAHDVVARGRVQASLEMACRFCMTPVRQELDEELTFVFRSGMTPVEAEGDEVYPLPAKARELDLGWPLREHVLLAVPDYVSCTETCRGLCPQCGTNLNQSSCACTVEDEDPRWAALRRLRSE